MGSNDPGLRRRNRYPRRQDGKQGGENGCYRFTIFSISENRVCHDLAWQKMVSVFPEITQTVSLQRDGNWEVKCETWFSRQGGVMSRYCGAAKAAQAIGGAIREMMSGFSDVYNRDAHDVDFLNLKVGVIYC